MTEDKISDKLTEKIKSLCSKGYVLYDKEQYREALRLFYQAWTLLPKPQTDHEQAGWVLTAIGDCYFKTEQWEQGKQSLTSALHCPNLKDNPFIHLRLGQCLLELEGKENAQIYLRQAYNKGGRDLFQDEAPKYLVAAMEND